MNKIIKINKIQVLVIYILFSIALFFLLKIAMVSVFISGNVDPLTEMRQSIFLLPYFFGSYAILLVGISFIGWRIFKKKNRAQRYGGFAYSLIYSLVLFLGFIIFLIYYLLQ
jgi:hypothetical protein